MSLISTLTGASELQKAHYEFYHSSIDSYNKEDAQDFCMWLSLNNYSINGHDPSVFYNLYWTADTISCYNFCREFEDIVEIGHKG